jgi:hypothetical protein
MSSGWIKLHRKLLDSQVFANEGLLKVWIYCLCRANHDVSYVPITTGKGTTEVKVDKGQFIFGRKSSAKDLGMNQSTLYKRLKKLEKLGNCNTQSNSHYTLVTICNWETYQDSKKPLEQGKEQPSNNQVTTREQPSNTDKNDNNYKNEKNTKSDSKESVKSFIPTLKECQDYAIEKGYGGELGKKFFDYYNVSIEDKPKSKYWKDSRGNPVKGWKQKMQVWFKPENKNTNQNQPKIIDGGYL